MFPRKITNEKKNHITLGKLHNVWSKPKTWLSWRAKTRNQIALTVTIFILLDWRHSTKFIFINYYYIPNWSKYELKTKTPRLLFLVPRDYAAFLYAMDDFIERQWTEREALLSKWKSWPYERLQNRELTSIKWKFHCRSIKYGFATVGGWPVRCSNQDPSSVREEDFNLRPPDYKSRALTTSPRRLLSIITPSSTSYSCTSIVDKNIIYLVVAESVSVHWAAVRVLRQCREYIRN